MQKAVKNLLNSTIITACFLILSAGIACVRTEYNLDKPANLAANTPKNAVYRIENEWMQLENGLAEHPAAPRSASKIKVMLMGEATYSDLNYDQQEDAVIVLTYQGGGSGTFFYLAAALYENGKYSGTEGILLGDRIGSPAIKINNGLITIEYLDRGHDEPMAAVPGILHTRYFILKGARLTEIKPGNNETIYQGLLTLGHEVRSFLPCSEKESLWLLGKSPALDTLIAEYDKTMASFPPYTPVFTILAGYRLSPPEHGFGADFKEAFWASRLVHISPKGNCRSDYITLDSPLPGETISSPLTIKGKARGAWFFEGDFPVILLDGQGKKVAESYVTAQGEWMTKNFVEFEGTIDFKTTYSGTRGALVLKKDNPTGLPQFDDSLEIPINIK